jgi:hypothetical protein
LGFLDHKTGVESMRAADNGSISTPATSAIGSLLDEATRRIVADLNHGFLRFCVAGRERSDPRFQLGEPVLARLGRLSGPGLQRAAASPFALFELRLAPAIEAAITGEDRLGGEPGVAGRAVLLAGPREQLFVQQVLFFAWHLACTAPLTGRLALGCPAAMQSTLRALSPSRFGDCCAHADVLRPRWPGHERFWFALLDAAENDADASLRRAHCLGIQLLAAQSSAQGEDPDSTRSPR